MPSRTRTERSGLNQQRLTTEWKEYLNNGTPTGQGSNPVSYGCLELFDNTCFDYVDPGDAHPLEVTKFLFDPPMISADKVRYAPNSGRYRIFSTKGPWGIDYDRMYKMYDTLRSGIPASSWPADSVLVTKALALTNPSVPSFSLLNFLFELRELPDLVRSAGEGFLKSIAGANIKTNFAIRPLINDVSTLLDFQSNVDKLIRTLEYAKRRGHTRRTRTLFSSDDTYPLRTISNNQGASEMSKIDMLVKRNVKVTIRGHVRWFPNGSFPKTDFEMNARARLAVLGIPQDSVQAASVAWNALPWSWLVDWFVSVNEYLDATNNSLGLSPKVIRLIREEVFEGNFSPVGGKLLTPYTSTGRFTRKYTKRYAPNTNAPSIDFKTEFLSWNRLSILASLYVLRSRRYDPPKPSKGTTKRRENQ